LPNEGGFGPDLERRGQRGGRLFGRAARCDGQYRSLRPDLIAFTLRLGKGLLAGVPMPVRTSVMLLMAHGTDPKEPA
jgi:hypothetical protein